MRTRAVVEILQEAIRKRTQIIADLDQNMIVFCPHAIENDAGLSYVLGFVLLGRRDLIGEPPESPQRWRWIPVHALRAPAAVPHGAWRTGPAGSRPALPRTPITASAA